MIEMIDLIAFEDEHELKEGEVLTLHVTNINREVITHHGKDADRKVILAKCEVLGPPVPVEGKLAELAEVNARLTEFVKSVAEPMQFTGNKCPLCGDLQEHKLYIQSQRAMQLL